MMTNAITTLFPVKMKWNDDQCHLSMLFLHCLPKLRPDVSFHRGHGEGEAHRETPGAGRDGGLEMMKNKNEKKIKIGRVNVTSPVSCVLCARNDSSVLERTKALTDELYDRHHRTPKQVITVFRSLGSSLCLCLNEQCIRKM